MGLGFRVSGLGFIHVDLELVKSPFPSKGSTTTRNIPALTFYHLGAEYPSPKKVNLSIMVGLYKPQKVKGHLLSY